MRFHPTRGSMSLLAEGRWPAARLGRAGRRRDPGRLRAAGRAAPQPCVRDAMVRVALAPCSPFSVTPGADAPHRRAGRAARRPPAHPPRRGRRRGHLLPPSVYGCRTIEHFEDVGWGTDRSWVAHCIYPNDDEIARLGGVGHRRRALPELEHDDRRRRPRSGRASSAPPACPSGIGCDGSSSTDSASLWMESPQRAAARAAARRARSRRGPATRSRSRPAAGPGASAVTGELGELLGRRRRRPRGVAPRGHPLRRARSATRSRRGCAAARCAARHTVVAGGVVVEDGALADGRRRRDARVAPPRRGAVPGALIVTDRRPRRPSRAALRPCRVPRAARDPPASPRQWSPAR